HDIADLKPADLLFSNRRAQHLLLARADESAPVGHRDRGFLLVAVEPAFDRAGLRVERDAQTPERPAVVSHRDEEAGGQAIEYADLAADQRRVSAEAHRADAERVGRLHDVIFEFRQLRMRVGVVERAEKLFFRVLVTGRAGGGDTDADGSRAAPLPLSLPDRVQDALAHAVQVAPGLAQMRNLHRQRVLNVLILTAAALEQQLDLDLAVVLPLLEMHRRRAGAQVV